ncbi:hypothetical protein BC826DRAFT_706953 [Russula brevipes]|nr:hypothetical protein BC826DRAFT_706953 [Russula brevipes]
MLGSRAPLEGCPENCCFHVSRVVIRFVSPKSSGLPRFSYVYLVVFARSRHLYDPCNPCPIQDSFEVRATCIISFSDPRTMGLDLDTGALRNHRTRACSIGGRLCCLGQLTLRYVACDDNLSTSKLWSNECSTSVGRPSFGREGRSRVYELWQFSVQGGASNRNGVLILSFLSAWASTRNPRRLYNSHVRGAMSGVLTEPPRPFVVSFRLKGSSNRRFLSSALLSFT